MKKFLLLLTLFIFSDIVNAQGFTTYYNQDGISGRINTINKIVDYKRRDQNELRFYNEKDESCKITGYVKIRYTELRTGKQDYTQKRFDLSVGPGQNSYVNCYFKPSWSRYGGIYEPVAFSVENVSFAKPRSSNTDNSYNSPRFFRTRTAFYGETHDSKEHTVYNPDGTCSSEGYTLVDGSWVKGTSKGYYRIERNVIYVTWDNWLNEAYVLTRDQYHNGPIIMKRQ